MHMQVRNTKTKLLVANFFKDNPNPLSLSQVFELVRVKLPKTAHSTVYRIVKDFLTDGKLIQIDWRQRGSFFEWADREHHHHLVCDSCNEITDIDDEVLGFQIEQLSRQTGFQIKNHSIEISGVCAPCQSSGPQK